MIHTVNEGEGAVSAAKKSVKCQQQRVSASVVYMKLDRSSLICETK